MAPSTTDIACSSCLARNRIPLERLGDQPVCGKCGTALVAAAPIELNDASFERYLSRTDLPVVVDFWAAWCGPCKAMAPQFAAAARAHAGKVLFVKVDTEAAPQTAARFSIQSIPTMILFRSGKEAARQSGAMGAAQIGQWLESQA